ncbi:MAG: response regulator transcription factor, partial [Mariprofundus sp.]
MGDNSAAATQMISILMVDDHAMVRSGFRRLLESRPEFCVVGEAESGEEGFRHYFELRPDVVLLDLLMPGEGGLATIRRLTSRDAQARILVLSMFDEPGMIRRVMDVGA